MTAHASGSGCSAPLGQVGSDGGGAGGPPARQVAGYHPSRQVAIALVDYVPQNKEELSFKRGDTIRDITAVVSTGSIRDMPPPPVEPLDELRGGSSTGSSLTLTLSLTHTLTLTLTPAWRYLYR